MLDRRTVVRAGAVGWTMPVILAAVATPAVAGSLPPPVIDTNPCTNGDFQIRPYPADATFVNGGGDRLVKGGTGIKITNVSTGSLDTVEVIFWTDSSQEALLVGSSGDALLSSKDGNKASVVLEIAPGETRVLRVDHLASNATAHIVLGCGFRFHFKAV